MYRDRRIAWRGHAGELALVCGLVQERGFSLHKLARLLGYDPRTVGPRPAPLKSAAYSKIREAVLARRAAEAEHPTKPKPCKRGQSRKDSTVPPDTRPLPLLELDAPTKVSGVLSRGMTVADALSAVTGQERLIEAHTGLRRALLRARRMRRRFNAMAKPERIDSPEGLVWLCGEVAETMLEAIHIGDFAAAKGLEELLAELSGHRQQSGAPGGGSNLLNINLAAVVARLDAEERDALPAPDPRLLEGEPACGDRASNSC